MLRIYYMDIEEVCTEEQAAVLYEILPPERKELVGRAKDSGIARKRICCGAFLQYVLSLETGLPVKAIRYRYNEWGKPELDFSYKTISMQRIAEIYNIERPLHFNLSHSGKYAVLAISDTPVGVDVEHKQRNYTTVAKRYFCREEWETIQASGAESARERCFLEYWTMKEAYVKCIGEGLRIPLDSFRIQRRQEGLSVVEHTDMWLGTFFLENGYCVSLCCDDRQTAEMSKKHENRKKVTMDEIICQIMKCEQKEWEGFSL